MASLLVVIELVQDRPRPASLELLGQARRVASRLGATVYAVVATARPPGYGDDDLIALLSGHGADKVLLATGAALGEPMRWGTHGGVVLGACLLVHPTVVLLADGHGARDLGGRVASRLSASAIGDAFVEAEDGELVLWQGQGPGALRLGGELDFVVVALVPAGRYPFASGDEEAEVQMLDAGAQERDFEPAGPPRPFRAIVVHGTGPAVAALSSLSGAVDAALPAELRIGAGAGAVELIAHAGEAGCRVALGESAMGAAAHFAVEGPTAPLAARLAQALAARGATGRGPIVGGGELP